MYTSLRFIYAGLSYSRALVLLAGFALSGCVALTSTPSPTGTSNDYDPRLGNYYFLPRGLIQIDGAEVSKDTHEFQVTLKTLNVPNKEWRYFLSKHTNFFYDDDLSLKVNPKGLLETVNITTEDKTPAVIDKVVDTFVDIARIATSEGINLTADDSTAGAPTKLIPFHVIFDPFEQDERNAAVKKLRDCGFKIKFPNPPWAEAHPRDGKSILLAERVRTEPGIYPAARESTGVVYRPPTIVEVEILTTSNVQTGLLQHVWVRMPDPYELAVLDTSRAFLVKKKNNYAFTDGDLIQVDHTKPSQALALVGIPASIVHKVAEAIPTLISLEDNRAKRTPPDLVEQKTQLDAQTALINSRLALLQAQQKLATTSSGGGGGGGQSMQLQESANLPPLTRKGLQARAKAEIEEANARTIKAQADAAEDQARLDRAQNH